MKHPKRLLALPGLLLLVLTSAVSAAPDLAKRPTPAAEGVQRSPALSAAQLQDISNYWTAERMASAIPLTPDVVKGDLDHVAVQPAKLGPAGSMAPAAPDAKMQQQALDLKGAPGSTNVLVDKLVQQAQSQKEVEPAYFYPYPFSRWENGAAYWQWPYSTMGKVFFTNASNGLNYVCSGTAVNTENRSVVWTAGHCVHGGGSGATWHRNWAFVPARRDGWNPYGVWYAREQWSLNGWITSANLRYDQGAAVLWLNNGRALANVVGGQGIAWNQPRNQWYYSFGYPAAAPFGGERQIICSAPYGADGFPWPWWDGPNTIGIGCDMTGGSSGGGWLTRWSWTGGGYVNSINSYRPSYQTLAMYGPYFGAGTGNLYNAVRNR